MLGVKINPNDMANEDPFSSTFLNQIVIPSMAQLPRTDNYSTLDKRIYNVTRCLNTKATHPHGNPVAETKYSAQFSNPLKCNTGNTRLRFYFHYYFFSVFITITIVLGVLHRGGFIKAIRDDVREASVSRTAWSPESTR